MRAIIQSHDPKKASRVTEGNDITFSIDLHRMPSTTKLNVRAKANPQARETELQVDVADYSVPVDRGPDPEPVTVWRGTLAQLKELLRADADDSDWEDEDDD